MATITFRVVNLNGTIATVQRLPVKCWRATFILFADSSTTSTEIDGARLVNMGNDPANRISGATQFVVGGVIDKDGRPVMVDKNLLVRFANAFRGGLTVIFEDFVP